MAKKMFTKAQKDDKTSDSKPAEGQAEQRTAKDASKQEKKEKPEIEALKKELEACKAELEKAKAETAKAKDDYLRCYADMENIRRRAAQDRLDLISTASSDVIKGMIAVLDDCEAALRMLPEGSEERQGVETIFNKLLSYLQTKGLEIIPAKGLEFDTDLHEAVAQFPVPQEDAKGKVFDVTQTGYKLGGKVLRFAKVVVGI